MIYSPSCCQAYPTDFHLRHTKEDILTYASFIYIMKVNGTQNCQAPKRTFCKSGSVKLINAIHLVYRKSSETTRSLSNNFNVKYKD